MSERFLPYGRQWVDDDDVEEVVEALRSDFLTTGPAVQRFEEALAEFTGTYRAVAVNSGTAALHAAYYGAGLQSGEEIITSPLTFVATGNAALYLGGSVRFVDVEPDTGNIAPAAVDAVVNHRSKLLVPVDYAGHPADYDALNVIARQRGLTVVADAAHSVGATYRERNVGCLADVTTLSFHPVKALTTAEGGAVLTNNAAFAARAEQFRSHGVTRERARLTRDDGPWYYEMHDLGFNYRISDINCALGLGQLRRLPAFLQRRREIAKAYNEAFADLPGVILPVARKDSDSAWHIYVLRVAEPQRRRVLFEYLRGKGLGVQVHYIPVYWQPYYQELGFKQGMCPNAEDFYSRAVSLPLFPKMSDSDVGWVIDIVRQAAHEVL